MEEYIIRRRLTMYCDVFRERETDLKNEPNGGAALTGLVEGLIL